MTKHLYLLPYGGLCNRLNAISAAFSLGALQEINIDILWVKKTWCEAFFSDLFLPLPKHHTINFKEFKALPLKYQRSLPRNLYLAGKLREILGIKNIENIYDEKIDILNILNSGGGQQAYLSACCQFLPNKDKAFLFTPQPSLQIKIDELAQTFSSSTYGVHIRRGDHTYAIAQSPIELFTERIAQLIDIDNNATFYLATDDEGVKFSLQERFGKRILTYEKATLLRSSLTGMQDAVIDLFVLSKTKAILGTAASTFSIVAAEIGGIPLEKIAK